VDLRYAAHPRMHPVPASDDAPAPVTVLDTVPPTT
jgi:hypothetical protein